jgi:hypothetical protein
MSNGTVFLPSERTTGEESKVSLTERPKFVVQWPGFSFWYTFALTVAIILMNKFVV